MAIRDAVKVSRKTFFNPRGWLDYDNLKQQTIGLLAILQTTFRPVSPAREESFEHAVERLNLTETDIQTTIKNYRLYALIFFCLGFITFCYAFFLLFYHHTFFGWLLGLCVCSFFLSQAFRFDFWSLQMRKRRLGLTFSEWKKSILGDKEASS